MIWFPSLSGIRQSSTLIPTRSTVISGLPPACPIDRTTSGSYFAIASSITRRDLWQTVGISNLMISAPSIVSGSLFTVSIAGLTFSPPNGSNPVTNIFILTSIPKRFTLRPRAEFRSFPKEYSDFALRSIEFVTLLHKFLVE